MKISLIIVIFCSIFGCLSSAFAQDSCLALYQQKGLVKDASLQAIDCYEKSLTSPEQQNQLSYLWFFHAEHEMAADNPESTTNLEKSFQLAKENALRFGSFLDFEAYKKLDTTQSRILARALYLYGVTLARISEKKGVMEVMNQWPEIQKVMKMIMRLKNGDLEFYGAYRTLAIANTRMPAPFGDKKIAQDYFDLMIQKTEQRDRLSAFLDNNLFYAEYLFSQEQEETACLELKKISEVLDSEISIWTPDHVYESQVSRRTAQQQFENKCLPAQP